MTIKKEEIILSFIRAFRNSLGDYNKFFFRRKDLKKNPELGIFFESEEERNSFLNFYNIMCFCNSEEYLLLSEKNVVTREELRNVKIFFSNTGSFYPKKYVDEILELLGRIEYYNNTFLKNLKITGKVMK